MFSDLPWLKILSIYLDKNLQVLLYLWFCDNFKVFS